MTEPAVELTDIIIDCADPHRLASFWAELLGRAVKASRGPYVWLERPPGAIGVGFQKVAEVKTGKNRVHLDISVADLPEGKKRIEVLGGRRVEGFERGGFLVMADPEGNEFCLVPASAFQFDEDGHTDYLDQLDLSGPA
jgi:predicted enzyme related to lactoylglutathione lyase